MPRNTYGVVGQNITLDCASPPPNQRVWYRPDGATVADNLQGIYPGYETQYAYQTSQRDVFVILEAALNDAGQYRCQNLQGNINAYAEVIVLRK